MDPKGRDKRIAKRKARQDNKTIGNYSGGNDVVKLKENVAAKKKLLSINEANDKADEMEAASKIIFDDDEDLYVQDAPLQSYLLSLEATYVKASAMSSGGLSCYNFASGIIDSGASATFFTSIDKSSNASVHKSHLRTANGQMCYTSHLRKTALPIGSKALHLHALVAPPFGDDLISVAQLTRKGNKVVFTKQSCLLLGPSANLNEGTIIREKRKDNLYRLTEKLTKPKGHNVSNAKLDLPKQNSDHPWTTKTRKKGPRVAPTVNLKQSHDVLNHSHSKTIEWFRSEYPDTMRHMENLSTEHEHRSCPPCSQGKATRAPFKQDQKNRYSLLEAVSSDSTGSITPTDPDGNKFIQILVDDCSGWADVQLMTTKSAAEEASCIQLTVD